MPGEPGDSSRAPQPARRLPGRYELRGLLGQGASGTVHAALDRETGRLVALKVVRSDPSDTPDARRAAERLRRELDVLSRLRHEGIPAIHEVVATRERTTIVMDLVEGETLEALVARGQLSLDARVRLVEEVARILHFVHEQGFVHRDVKPSNVVVGADGHARLIDFGIVKDAAAATLTATGAFVGTPAFMSPEQARGEGREADPRSDVFSLGAVLYFALAGRPPFQGQSVVELVVAVASRAPDPIRDADHPVPAELEAIALHALEKDPARRHVSAQALALDLEAWRTGASAAPRPSPIRWAALGALAVVALGGFALVASGRLSPGRPVTESRPAPAGTPTPKPSSAPAPVAAVSSPTRAAFPALCSGFLETKRTKLAALLGGYEWKDSSLVPSVAFLPDGKRAVVGSLNWSSTLVDLRDGSEIRRYGGCAGSVTSVDVTPDGERLLVGSRDGFLHVLRVADGVEVRRVALGAGIESAARSPLGSVVACGCSNGAVKLVDSETGADVRALPGHEGAVGFVAFSRDGLRVLSVAGGTARVFDLASGEEVQTVSGAACAALLSDGQRALVAGADGSLVLWDLVGKEKLRALEGGGGPPVNSIEVSRDGRRALLGDDTGVVTLWSLDEGRKLWARRGHWAPVLCVAFSPDETQVLSSSQDGTYKLWDLASITVNAMPPGHEGQVRHLALAASGAALASGGAEGRSVLWDVSSSKLVRELRTTGVVGLRFEEGDRRVLVAGADGSLRSWGADSGTRLFEGTTEPRVVWTAVAFGDDSRVAYAATPGGSIAILDLETRSVRREIPTPGSHGITALDVSADGTMALAGTADGYLHLVDLATGRIDGSPRAHTGYVYDVAVSRDGARGLSAGEEGRLLLWPVGAKQGKPRLLDDGPFWQTAAAFSPDGRLALSATNTDEIRLWDVASGERLDTISLASSGDVARTLRFAADGRTFAAGTSRGVVLMFEVRPEK